MAPSAEAVRLRAERAAKGNKKALQSIQQGAVRSQQLKKLRDDAAAGDKQAQLRLEEHRVQGRLKMRQQRAKDQAKRDAGDADAIADISAHSRRAESGVKSVTQTYEPSVTAQQEHRVITSALWILKSGSLTMT